MHVSHHKQELPYSCLPACVRMVLAFYGLQRSESELRALLKTRPGGTSPAHVMLRLPDLGVFLNAWAATDRLMIVIVPIESTRRE